MLSQRNDAEGVLEPDPFFAEPIDVRRLEMLVPGQAEGIPALIVGDDDDDIGLLARLTGVGERGEEEEGESDEGNADLANSTSNTPALSQERKFAAPSKFCVSPGDLPYFLLLTASATFSTACPMSLSLVSISCVCFSPPKLGPSCRSRST